MKQLKKHIEKNKIQKMIKTNNYIIIRSGFELNGLMHKKTNKIYKPKYDLFVEVY